MQSVVSLKGARPLLSGTYRDIYQHPHDDDLLIKVVRKSVVEKYRLRRNGYGSWRRYGHFKTLLRELHEYLVLRQRGLHELPFIQRFAGMVETDAGLGMVVSKLRGSDGNLAPTLERIVRSEGLTAPLRASLEMLKADLMTHHVTICDVSARNIVRARDEVHGDRLVFVDGFGDRLLVPINLYSRTANAWSTARRFQRMMRKLESIDALRVAPPGRPA